MGHEKRSIIQPQDRVSMIIFQQPENHAYLRNSGDELNR